MVPGGAESSFLPSGSEAVMPSASRLATVAALGCDMRSTYELVHYPDPPDSSMSGSLIGVAGSPSS